MDTLWYSRLNTAARRGDTVRIELVTPDMLETAYPGGGDKSIPWWWWWRVETNGGSVGRPDWLTVRSRTWWRRWITEYKSRCQGCGRCGPDEGGLATLHVHHIQRDPDEMEEHDLDNLTLLCRSCHSWLHQQSTPDDSPVEITQADQSVLLPQDIEILRILADSGPATTGDIASALSADLTVTAVRERLWMLMGLDNLISSRDRQIVDQHADTGEWGLAEQIEYSTRGRIPSDPQLLSQRVEDEYVRQALERGCDRDAVMEVLDISRRSTFYKEKRARAYDIPLAAIRKRGGGRPLTDDVSDEADAPDLPETAGEAQQRLDTVADGRGHEDATGVDKPEQATGDSLDQQEQSDTQPSSERVKIQNHIQQAIAALQSIDGGLNTT